MATPLPREATAENPSPGDLSATKGILKLPDELLLLIIESLPAKHELFHSEGERRRVVMACGPPFSSAWGLSGCYQSSAIALCRVSRRFNRLATPFVYSHVLFQPLSQSDMFSTVLRSPALALHARTLQIGWWKPWNVQRLEDMDDFSQFEARLAPRWENFVNLQALAIRGAYLSMAQRERMLTTLHEMLERMPNLRAFCFTPKLALPLTADMYARIRQGRFVLNPSKYSGSMLGLEDIVQLLARKSPGNLGALHIEVIQPLYRPLEVKITECHFHVRSLVLNRFANTPHNLARFLRMVTRLEHFSLPPLHRSPPRISRWFRYVEVKLPEGVQGSWTLKCNEPHREEWSVRSILSCLSPHSETLGTLHLYDTFYDDIEDDGKQSCLADFRNLEELGLMISPAQDDGTLYPSRPEDLVSPYLRTFLWYRPNLEDRDEYPEEVHLRPKDYSNWFQRFISAAVRTKTPLKEIRVLSIGSHRLSMRPRDEADGLWAGTGAGEAGIVVSYEAVPNVPPCIFGHNLSQTIPRALHRRGEIWRYQQH